MNTFLQDSKSVHFAFLKSAADHLKVVLRKN